MKKYLTIVFALVFMRAAPGQEVLRLKNGATITVQSGTGLFLQGGITLENGSLLINNGTTWLKNNPVANQSDWRDNSFIGALGGTGLVVFNSDLSHQYYGPTNFYNLRINTGEITLNNPLSISHELNLVKGKINTGINYLFLDNDNPSSLLNDALNAGYTQCWINGNFRRGITNNSGVYDFPVGNSSRPNLLQFLNNNISGTGFLTASFGPKPGTDAGLNVVENAAMYSSINNGGVWYLTPNTNPASGNYALHLYFNGFNGLSDNLFGILRRPDASSNAADWMVPAGSLLEAINGLGRKVSDGFARRYNITSFSQWGIGHFATMPCEVCDPVCTYTQGFYSNPRAMGCYYNNGNSSAISSGQLMLNAFGANSYQVFGNIANRQFFTLFKTDISNGNIFKMLPGFGSSQPMGVDNILPYSGAYYSDKTTWYLVPIETNGNQKGKIKNLLLSQLMSLWFNLRTSNSLSAVDLTNDTLVTIAQTNCGSGIPTGIPSKFGLPHSVILYLNGGNGYTHNVNGLYQLANDVLGGANNAITAADVQAAVARINGAFDGCKILVGTIPFSSPPLFTKNPGAKNISEIKSLIVSAFPNPYEKQFNLKVTTPVSGMATIEFYSGNGSKIHTQSKFLEANVPVVIQYTGPRNYGVLIYKLRIRKYEASGIVIGPN